MSYYLAYDTPIGVVAGEVKRRKGRQSCTPVEHYPIEQLLRTASSLCEIYGDGTHWIEDEAGNKIEPAKPCPEKTENLTLRDVLVKVLEGELGDSYDCTRVWEAWWVNTMRADDFLPVEDRIDEIADAILRALEVTPEMQRAIWAETAMDAIPSWYNGYGRTDTKALDAWFIKNFRPVQTFPKLGEVFASQHDNDKPTYHGA